VCAWSCSLPDVVTPRVCSSLRRVRLSVEGCCLHPWITSHMPVSSLMQPLVSPSASRARLVVQSSPASVDVLMLRHPPRGARSPKVSTELSPSSAARKAASLRSPPARGVTSLRSIESGSVESGDGGSPVHADGGVSGGHFGRSNGLASPGAIHRGASMHAASPSAAAARPHTDRAHSERSHSEKPHTERALSSTPTAASAAAAHAGASEHIGAAGGDGDDAVPASDGGSRCDDSGSDSDSARPVRGGGVGGGGGLTSSPLSPSRRPQRVRSRRLPSRSSARTRISAGTSAVGGSRQFSPKASPSAAFFSGGVPRGPPHITAVDDAETEGEDRRRRCCVVHLMQLWPDLCPCMRVVAFRICC
jgi:hypothetical protein